MLSSRRRILIAIPLVGIVIGFALGRALWQHHTCPPSPVRNEPVYPVRTQEIMATPITVQAPSAQIDQAAEIVFRVFRTVDAEMSEWKDTSPLSAVNANAGIAPVTVPVELRSLIARAIEIGDLTDGAFDCTWAALWDLWDFKAENPLPPSDVEIAARLPLVDSTAVRIDEDNGTVFLPARGMLIGLGGIAKGYALDRAAEALRDAGITSFLLTAGGQVLVGDLHRAGKQHKDLRPWRIGIRDPRGNPEDIFATIELINTSLSTTGDYEKYFIHKGVRYHHVLDPRTGRPARGVRAVTVITPDATLSDALSTALMILGVERGLEIAQSLPGVEAVFIDETGSVHVSPGIAKKLRLTNPLHTD